MLILYVTNNDRVYLVDKCGKLRQRPGSADGQFLRAFENGKAISTAGVAVLRACSACAGDYEDPERTAETPDEASGEGNEGESGVFLEEFPGEEQ
jgi:hypothetical protein